MNSSTKFRTGFTLVELLFVVAIIAVLATMSLGIMKSAQDDAKESASLSRIMQVETILKIELEDYEVRRLPVSVRTLADYARANPLYVDGGGNPINIALQVRNLKRRILQDIISSEYPRPLVSGMTFLPNPDVGVFPTTQIPLDSTQPSPVGFQNWLNNNYPMVPAGYGVSLRVLLTGVASSKVISWQTTPAINLPGEFLYESLKRIDIDGAPAIESLGTQAFGDTDNDGFLEVVDAWGEPMQLRIWQVDAQEVNGAGVPTPGTDIWQDDPTANFDVADATGAPTGYAVIDSTVPREINKIRFQVVSTRLPF